MGTKLGEDTFVLFPVRRSSFLQGVGSAIDVTGALVKYNISESPEVADGKAIAADWRAVGKDLYRAIAEYITLSK